MSDKKNDNKDNKDDKWRNERKVEKKEIAKTLTKKTIIPKNTKKNKFHGI